jgi:hypothetical protein
MTERKITYQLNKIKKCKEEKYYFEALLRSYHLNVELIRYILTVASPQHSVKDQKTKTLVKIFLHEMSMHPELKSIINKKSLKSLKPWLKKMDEVFRNLKMAHPVNFAELQSECEKIFGILKISANKLLLKGAQ